MTKTKAIYAGSFDPVTKGHLDVVLRASRVFDVVVAVGNNPSKTTMFTLEERQHLVAKSLEEMGLEATVVSFEGLLVQYCKEHDIPIILRGLRSGTDFDYELNLAQINRTVNYRGIDTFFLPTNPAHSFISSSMVRELAKHGALVDQYVTPFVDNAIVKRCAEIQKLNEIRKRISKVNPWR